MTSDELAPIIGAMTERPWKADHHCCIESPSQDGNPERATRMTVTVLGGNGDENERAIAALANHADALVELVRACERWTRDEGPTPAADIEAALAKVHAVGKEGE